ncbi:hypothetical protein J4Q44_G00237380 [Coregonus suidteri]|uniref:uDENN domain-containing protein n=1 Tax=Coregonus suidteri TaxID=861788 RepID=A0AAN8L8R4_9TELE
MGSRIKDNPEATFEVYLEVTHPGTAGSDPEVRRRFPEDYIDQETLQTVPKFCFPFSVDSDSNHSRNKAPNPHSKLATITFDNPIVSPSPHKCNLGIILDFTLSFHHHIQQTVKTSYFHLHNISRCPPSPVLLLKPSFMHSSPHK